MKETLVRRKAFLVTRSLGKNLFQNHEPEQTDIDIGAS